MLSAFVVKFGVRLRGISRQSRKIIATIGRKDFKFIISLCNQLRFALSLFFVGEFCRGKL